MSGKLMFEDSVIGLFSVSKRRNAKRITLSVSKNGTPNVTLPPYVPIIAAKNFIAKNRQWVTEHAPERIAVKPKAAYELYDGTTVEILPAASRNSSRTAAGSIEILLTDEHQLDYFNKVITRQLASDSRNAILPRVHKFQTLLKVKPSAVRFRSTTSRWGSCNSRKVLTFSVYIAQLPNELIDYIVIHELAHIIQMNHSKDFWSLVAAFDPQYRQHRHELKDYKLKPYLKKL